MGLAALERAIALNGVAVALNLQAFALGRLALAAPEALHSLAGAALPAPDLDALDGPQGLIARRQRHLTAYQDAALAARYTALVEGVRQAETALGDAAAQRLDLTRAVARQHARLLAVKDEYEVARLHLAPAFDQALRQQFARWDRIVHHLAPPLLSRKGPDGGPRKRPFGPWVRLAGDYEGLVERELLPRLRVDSLPLAVRIAETAQLIRGYGHVKAAGIAAARAQWRELLAQWHQGPDGSAGAAPVGRRVIGIKPLAEAVRGPLGKARQSAGKS